MLTQDKIIQVAREAGLDWHAGFSVGDDEENRYERLFRMAYAAGHKDGQREMREQCAAYLEAIADKPYHSESGGKLYYRQAAKSLRTTMQIEIREPV